jgi:hypothetical protein
MRWENLTKLSFLKIDAEGTENDVLSGARYSIETYRPIILAEVNISEVTVALRDYMAFQAESSPNRCYIPREHDKVRVARELGWREV